jgi:hypothetical protein
VAVFAVLLGLLGGSLAGLPLHPTAQTGPGGPALLDSGPASGVSIQLLPAAGGPQIIGFSFLPNPIFLGNSTTIGVNASGGSGALTFAYVGLPPGCSSQNLTRFTCWPAASGVYPVNATVTDQVGAHDSAIVNLTVQPTGGGAGPQITAFGAQPAVLSIGQSTHFVVAVQGGVGALSYDYQLLPPGCSSANLSDLLCTPTTTGAFHPHVEVTDASGNRTGADTGLTVNPIVAPGPSISLFAAAPATVRAGTPTTFLVSVSGGVAPLTYAYSGLPPGCDAVNAPSLNCTPTDPGVFPVQASIQDSLGRYANSSTTLTVLPALTGTGGQGSDGTPAFGGIATIPGLAAIAFVAMAALLFASTELVLRGRRLREEGLDLVRAMSEDAQAQVPKEPPRP